MFAGTGAEANEQDKRLGERSRLKAGATCKADRKAAGAFVRQGLDCCTAALSMIVVPAACDQAPDMSLAQGLELPINN